MAIKEFEQGKKSAKDIELFGLIGHYLVDVKIHQKLGTAITSNVGDVWLVSQMGKGEVRGFGNMRLLKNDKCHIRFIHCEESSPMICETMILHFIATASASRSQVIYTNDTADNPFWGQFGFTFTPPTRGKYGRWEKVLEKSS